MLPDEQIDEGMSAAAHDLGAAALALARRFGSGATLWCWAPGHRSHAQHVAVEFVHPVIVGKRALPAVAVDADGGDVVAVLRALVRTGDVILVVDTGGVDAGGVHENVASVLYRARAWGALTVWLGAAGRRPGPGEADHVLGVEGGDPLGLYDGRYVLTYHLLWELTHVCFEHPGLLHGEPPGDGPICPTCSDEGRLAEVVSATQGSAVVRTPAGLETVDLAISGPLHPGNLILVHAGSALAVVGSPA